MDYDLSLLERVNPVFNTGKMTAFNLASTGDEDAKQICEKLGLTFEETQNSSNTVTSPEQQKISDIMMETRFRTAYNMAEKQGYKTLVDLPCGFTSRGIKCARSGMNYIGLDLPATIAELEPAVRSILGPGKEDIVKYAGVDATNLSSLEKALEGVSGEICITTEGLLMYFTDSETSAFCDNVRRILEEHGGCWIAADPEVTIQYVMTARMVYGDQFEKVMMNSAQKVKDKSDVEIGKSQILVKPAKDTAENMKRAMAFLARHGLKAERLAIADYMPELFCLKDEPEFMAAYKGAMANSAYWKITAVENAQESKASGEKSFDVRASLNGDVLDITLTGRVDTLTAPKVLEDFEKIEKEETINSVKVNCSQLDYVSSAGLRVLLIMHKKCPGGVTLEHVNDLVKEILDQTGFSDFFTIH